MRPDTLEEYLSLFAAARPRAARGRGVLVIPDVARRPRARIAELQPAARIIAILREPASFLRSLHLQIVRVHIETERTCAGRSRSSASGARAGTIPRHSSRPPALMYSEHVRYVEQLRRYHALFPREQVLVLIYDDFRRDNEATVRRVLRFLEVDDSLPIEVVEANPDGARALTAAARAGAGRVSVGRGPVSASGEGGGQGAHLQAHAPRRAARAAAPHRLRRAASRPTSALMLELRAPLQARRWWR